MRVKRVKEIVFKLAYVWYNVDGRHSKCYFCEHFLEPFAQHEPDCIIQELYDLVDAGSYVRTYGQPINRYCFVCKKITRFTHCDNCSMYFCYEHCDFDKEGDWEHGYYTTTQFIDVAMNNS